MKCLFITLPAIGHLNPLVGLAEVLTRNNIDCIFLSSPNMKEYFHAANKKVVLTDTHYVEMVRRRPERKPFRNQISDPNFLKQAIQFELQTFEVNSIDLVIVDSFFSAPISATLAGIRWISHFSGGFWFQQNSGIFENWDVTEANRNLKEIMFEYGINKLSSSIPDILFSPYFNVVSGLPDFMPRSPRKPPSVCIYAGYLRTDYNPYGCCNGLPEPSTLHKPLIYVNFGTLNYDPDLYLMAEEAVKEISGTMVAITGELSPNTFRVQNGDLLYRKFLDREEFWNLMIHVDAAIVHGGFNTVMECLYNGIPMVVMPANERSDQPYNGRCVEKLGVGKLVYRRQGRNELRKALARVISDERYFHSVRYYKNQLRKTKGFESALKEFILQNGVGG